MENSESQSAEQTANNDLKEITSTGSLTGGPPSELPDQAIEREGKVAHELQGKIDFSEQTHQYIRDYIHAADQKAAFFFAAFAGLIGYSNSIGVLTSWVVNVSTWDLGIVVAFAHTLLVLFAAFCCLWVVKPRLRGSAKGLIFFNSIAQHESAADFVTEFSDSDISKLLTEKVKHTFEISKVCKDKYFVLGIGLWTGGIGAMLLVLILLFESET